MKVMALPRQAHLNDFVYPEECLLQLLGLERTAGMKAAAWVIMQRQWALSMKLGLSCCVLRVYFTLKGIMLMVKCVIVSALSLFTPKKIWVVLAHDWVAYGHFVGSFKPTVVFVHMVHILPNHCFF